ncbi:MAG: hypothetical protein ACRDTA_09130 [Pseudonocardiaceae bacterium]
MARGAAQGQVAGAQGDLVDPQIIDRPVGAVMAVPPRTRAVTIPATTPPRP